MNNVAAAVNFSVFSNVMNSPSFATRFACRFACHSNSLSPVLVGVDGAKVGPVTNQRLDHVHIALGSGPDKGGLLVLIPSVDKLPLLRVVPSRLRRAKRVAKKGLIYDIRNGDRVGSSETMRTAISALDVDVRKSAVSARRFAPCTLSPAA